MLAVELWLSLIYAWYNGAMVVALTELIPATVRTSGFSLAYSLATTLGGSSLLISTWLIAHTGDNAAPGYWMSFAALCGLVATSRSIAALRAASSTRPPARPWAARRARPGRAERKCFPNPGKENTKPAEGKSKNGGRKIQAVSFHESIFFNGLRGPLGKM